MLRNKSVLVERFLDYARNDIIFVKEDDYCSVVGSGVGLTSGVDEYTNSPSL